MNAFESLSRMYSDIIFLTLAVAPADWTRLWLRTSCEEGAWSIGGYWERDGIDEVIFFPVPSEASELVYESWKVSRSHNDHWSTAIFRVDRPDKLQITFGHEDLDDESYSPSESQAVFRAQTFGDREIDDSSIDMSGAVALTPEMLRSGIVGP